MAIRIEYGDVAGYAGLGVLAGKATAEREAVQRQAAMDRQVMQVQAQRASQERAQAHQKEMTEFDAYMDNIRYQSAEAWELEKMELRSRHDFEMIEAKREMDFQNQMQREMRQQQEMDAKIKAINEAEHLSAEERGDAILKVQTGVTIPRRTGQPIDDWRERYMNIAAGDIEKPKTSPGQVAVVLKQVLPTLNAVEQDSVRKVIAGGDVNKMYEVLKILKEGK